jgi:ABC-type sugar transport system ATPase subunit
LFPEPVEGIEVEATLEIFDVLDDWLHKKAVLTQSDAQKEMRNMIKPLLEKYGLERKLSKEIVALLVKTYA